jgi:hypothetical protein
VSAEPADLCRQQAIDDLKVVRVQCCQMRCRFVPGRGCGLKGEFPLLTAEEPGGQTHKDDPDRHEPGFTRGSGVTRPPILIHYPAPFQQVTLWIAEYLTIILDRGFERNCFSMVLSLVLILRSTFA